MATPMFALDEIPTRALYYVGGGEVVNDIAVEHARIIHRVLITPNTPTISPATVSFLLVSPRPFIGFAGATYFIFQVNVVLAQNANLPLFARGAGANFFTLHKRTISCKRQSPKTCLFSSTHHEEVVFSLLVLACLIMNFSPCASIACGRRVLHSIFISSFNLVCTHQRLIQRP